jgi:hypothetical protein
LLPPDPEPDPDKEESKIAKFWFARYYVPYVVPAYYPLILYVLY